MPRDQDQRTFGLDVEGVGNFAFRHRTMRDELRIATEYSRLTEGIDTPSKQLDAIANMLSTVKVLCAEPPDGWDIETMDPLDPQTFAQLFTVYSALREREKFFRSRPGQTGQGEG